MRLVPTVDPKFLSQIRYRCIGPTRGGRVVAVAADPKRPAVFYFGAVAGGVWKSDDAGQYWQNVTDGFLTTASIGALAVAPSDGNVIYAGTGESTIRIDVTHGDGVYKSTDAGVTWRHIGLDRISPHRRDPRPPRRSRSRVRRRTRSRLEGQPRARAVPIEGRRRDWELVLHVSDRAGAVDVSLDPNNPRIIFATIWQTRRTFWSIDSGGPDSGLWRSRDGGDTWQDISHHPGMPDGMLGKIGVSVSPARSGRVFAMVEAEGRKRGLYRSDDIGETWEKVSSKPDLGWRPWYYQHVIAHPTHADEVFVMNMKAWRSIDGGKTFEEFHTPHGDNHALWIDPANPDRMIGCDDGGAWVSFNAGASWSTIYNQLTAEFYHVATDDQFPYMVYGSQQDNSSIARAQPDRPRRHQLGQLLPARHGREWVRRAQARRPEHRVRGCHRQLARRRRCRCSATTTRPSRSSSSTCGRRPYHDGNTAEVRFQWTYPIVFSPHDSNVLYAAGNKVFRTTDEGHSWQAISPDLTYADPDTMGVSGPLTMDTAGAEMYGTDLLADGVRAPAGCADGRVRRRPGAPVDQRRRRLDERHATRPAEVLAGHDDRRVAAHAGHRLHDGGPPQDGRLRAVRLQDRRPRHHVDDGSMPDCHSTSSAASSARTRTARVCCTSAPSSASTCRSTTAPTGSRCSATFPSRPSTTSSSRTPTSWWRRTGARSGSSTT